MALPLVAPLIGLGKGLLGGLAGLGNRSCSNNCGQMLWQKKKGRG